MKPLSDIRQAIAEILTTEWKRRESAEVPESENVRLGNDAVELSGTVLYADLVDSTALVQGYKDWFVAEVYKTYLMTASELIKNHSGAVTAFDGDRVMGVFVGGYKNSSAVKCALQINYIVSKIINPLINEKYPNTSFQLKQVVGIDTSRLFVAKTGIRGANDLVWVGRSANYAAKLCALRDGLYSTFITNEVFTQLSDETKYGGGSRQLMWTKFNWTEFGLVAYKSSWTWKPN